MNMHGMIYLVSFYLLRVIEFETKSLSEIHPTRSLASFRKEKKEKLAA
jgi:hypothetical protein